MPYKSPWKRLLTVAVVGLALVASLVVVGGRVRALVAAGRASIPASCLRASGCNMTASTEVNCPVFGGAAGPSAGAEVNPGDRPVTPPAEAEVDPESGAGAPPAGLRFGCH